MATLHRTSKPLSTRLNHFFQYRSERERAAFESVRRAISLPTIIRRRSAAREIAPHASFTIDREQGFKVFPPGIFAEATEIVGAAPQLVARTNLDEHRRSKKARAGFMVPLLDTRDLTVDSPIIRLAIRPDVIAAVSAYLRVVPVVAHINVYYSESGSDEPRLSQLFHCVGDATAQVKIFVLCNDVTSEQGPLTLLDARTSRAVRRRVGYSFGDRIKDSDKRVTSLIGPANQHPIVGEAGTVCFVDTTECFHFGSRVERGAAPRLVTVIQYLPPSSFELPRDHRAGSPFRRLAGPELTYAQRLVLGAI
jgi:hypothetical protein